MWAGKESVTRWEGSGLVGEKEEETTAAKGGSLIRGTAVDLEKIGVNPVAMANER
jgi:hypothetical protein